MRWRVVRSLVDEASLPPGARDGGFVVSPALDTITGQDNFSFDNDVWQMTFRWSQGLAFCQAVVQNSECQGPACVPEPELAHGHEMRVGVLCVGACREPIRRGLHLATFEGGSSAEARAGESKRASQIRALSASDFWASSLPDAPSRHQARYGMSAYKRGLAKGGLLDQAASVHTLHNRLCHTDDGCTGIWPLGRPSSWWRDLGFSASCCVCGGRASCACLGARNYIFAATQPLLAPIRPEVGAFE